MGSLTSLEAVLIASQSYDESVKNVPVEINEDITITWETQHTIEDEDTGLKGYVLQKEDTGKVVISFEGTQLNRGVEQAINDLETDAFGIVLGNQSYTGNTTSQYYGSPAQDARISAGLAEIDEEGNFRDLNENQFTEAAPIVDTYVEKYGKDNITFVGHSLGGGLAEYFAVQHDTDAITFAAADTYDLLTDEQQQRVKDGDYKDKIISYTYPDDIVGTWHNQTIGSLYYMSNPSENTGRWFNSHGINENYASDVLFDENGYFQSSLLYDSTLHTQLKTSPLKMKNNGVHNFTVIIKSEILKSYAREIEANADLIEQTETSLQNFYDFYIDELTNIKHKYLRSVGSGNYDRLSAEDVEDIFRKYGRYESGVPMMFDMEDYEFILFLLKKARRDTAEIAFNMEKMGNDFDETDQLLAQWLGF